jgi:hypothetical protein
MSEHAAFAFAVLRVRRAHARARTTPDVDASDERRKVFTARIARA